MLRAREHGVEQQERHQQDRARSARGRTGAWARRSRRPSVRAGPAAEGLRSFGRCRASCTNLPTHLPTMTGRRPDPGRQSQRILPHSIGRVGAPSGCAILTAHVPDGRHRRPGAARAIRARRGADAVQPVRRGPAHDAEPGRRRGPGAGDLPARLPGVRRVQGGHQPEGVALSDPHEQLHQHLPQEAASSHRPSTVPTTSTSGTCTTSWEGAASRPRPRTRSWTRCPTRT